MNWRRAPSWNSCWPRTMRSSTSQTLWTSTSCRTFWSLRTSSSRMRARTTSSWGTRMPRRRTRSSRWEEGGGEQMFWLRVCGAAGCDGTAAMQCFCGWSGSLLHCSSQVKAGQRVQGGPAGCPPDGRHCGSDLTWKMLQRPALWPSALNGRLSIVHARSVRSHPPSTVGCTTQKSSRHLPGSNRRTAECHAVPGSCRRCSRS